MQTLRTAARFVILCTLALVLASCRGPEARVSPAPRVRWIPPGYQKLRDVDWTYLNDKPRAVLGVYGMGMFSQVEALKAASSNRVNHNITFLTADHDICRLTLGELEDKKILGGRVLMKDCPMFIFLRYGKEFIRSGAMDAVTFQSMIDKHFHGTRAARARVCRRRVEMKKKPPVVPAVPRFKAKHKRLPLGSGPSLFAPPSWKPPSGTPPSWKPRKTGSIAIYVLWVAPAAGGEKPAPEFRVELDDKVVADWRTLPADKEMNLYSRDWTVGTRRVALKYARSVVVDGEKIRRVRKEHKDVEIKAGKSANVRIEVDDKVGYFVWTVSHVEEGG
jgi:hypothetical protein